jgi:hypothetical protein
MGGELPSERQVQRAILKMIDVCFRGAIAHHSPNGAHLAGNDTARFKQMGALLGDGMRKGWPDLIVVWRGGIAFIEVKRPKNFKISDDQKKVHDTLDSLGWPVATITSAEAAYRFLRECGAPCSAEMIGVAA